MIWEMLFPRTTCMVCDGNDELQSGLCGNCCRELASLLLPDAAEEASSLPHPQCRSAYRYDGCARTLVGRLKFDGEPRLAAKILSRQMILLAQKHCSSATAVIPVPLSLEHIQKRGYNQALYLSRPVAKALKIPIPQDWLWRIRNTQRQTELGKEERIANLHNAFCADPKVAGQSILLIDDVFTTGSTLASCTEALKTAGAKNVLIMTATRAGKTSS